VLNSSALDNEGLLCDAAGCRVIISREGAGSDEWYMSRLTDGDAPTAKPGRERACDRVLLVIRKEKVGRPNNLVVEVDEIASSRC
jgi:hypothetical protein